MMCYEDLTLCCVFQSVCLSRFAGTTAQHDVEKGSLLDREKNPKRVEL